MTDVPDTSTPIIIDPFDPLLEHFALQHDLRERYLHALEQILAINLDYVACTTDDAAEQMKQIAKEAIGSEQIEVWLQLGRPLPWVDEKFNPLAERVRDEVLAMLKLKDLRL